MENNSEPPPGDNPNSHHLKQLNKLSHKISKPPITATSIRKLPPPPSPEQPQLAPQQHQPPVYNISKSDFRDIVQKLTGSPAHSLMNGSGSGSGSGSAAAASPPASAPPPMMGPGTSSKPPSSRLQRIRPPPLAQLSNRPPGMLGCAGGGLQPPPPFFNHPPVNPNSFGGFRPTSGGAPPLSPLPPLPSVHASAESPVSAYMRYLRGSPGGGFSEPARQLSPLAPLVSPRWNSLAPPPQHPPAPDQSYPSMFPQLPTSPLPFGCMSPQSAATLYPPLHSPGLLLSPTAFPLSPTLPVPSPKGRGL